MLGPSLKSRVKADPASVLVGLCLWGLFVSWVQAENPAEPARGSESAASTPATTNAPVGPPRSPYLDWLPPSDGFDWIQLKSGEWLKGRVRAMQDKKLEFDSDELDIQTFDWEDVWQLRSPKASLLFDDNSEPVVGAVVVDPFFVRVTGRESLRFPRSGLRGLTPGELKEINYWTGKLSLGLNVRSGNTEQSDMVAHANLQRRTPRTSLRLEYLGNLGVLDGIENVNNHRASLSYDIFLTRRFFLRPVFAEYYRDPFQNVAHRGTIGLGAGYYLLDTPKTDWLISGGPAFQYTVFDTVEEGKDPNRATPGLLIQSVFDKELTKRIDLELTYQGIVINKAAGTMTHHSVSTIELELTRILDVDISFVWDRIENPQPIADGVVPEKNDFRLNLMLGVDF